MITKRGKPITGSRPAMRPTSNVLTDQARTSSGAQRVVRQPPAPFQNPRNQLNVPAPTHPQFRSSGKPKELNYQISKHSIHNGTSLSADMMAAVGYAPNATKPKAGNSIISGNPLSGNARRVGNGNQPNARRGR